MLTPPIVEGAYYVAETGKIFGPAKWGDRDQQNCWVLNGIYFQSNGVPERQVCPRAPRLTRRVWLVPTDPAEVVAELRELADKISKARHPQDDLGRGQEGAFEEAADLVAEKLGVGNG